MGMFDEQSLGIPTISWKGIRKGTVITGTILPLLQKGKSEPVSYREVQDTDRAGQLRFFPSGDPILRGEFLIQTELRGWDKTSAEFEQRTEQYPDETDEGLRRWIVGSKYATQAVRAAFKQIRKAPEIGGVLTVTVTGVESGKTSDGESYTFPNLTVTWSDPTPTGRSLADAYATEHYSNRDDTGGSSMFAGGDDAPPF